MTNFNTIFKKAVAKYSNINSGVLLDIMLKYHVRSGLHGEIDNGNMALVMDYLNNEDIIYKNDLWKLLQDFIYRFYDTVNYNFKLNSF